MGYNGAGKTTLLQLIAGLYRPDGGNITADTEGGKLAVYGSEQVRRDLFLIPDDPYILPRAGLYTMAAFYRDFYPHFSMETLQKLTDIFGLDPKKKLNGFSKGMKRQAALILGLSSRARYLLLDESFDGLDPNIRMTVCDLLLEYMSETGATIVMASHNLHEIEHICDTVGMLNGTHIVYSCEIDAIKERYTPRMMHANTKKAVSYVFHSCDNTVQIWLLDSFDGRDVVDAVTRATNPVPAEAWDAWLEASRPVALMTRPGCMVQIILENQKGETKLVTRYLDDTDMPQ